MKIEEAADYIRQCFTHDMPHGLEIGIMPGKTEPAKLATEGQVGLMVKIMTRKGKLKAPASIFNSNIAILHDKDKIAEKPVVTYNIYSKPASRPSIASMHEKYRIPWRDEPAPSFIDGFVSAFDLLGASSPKAKEPPRRSRRHSRLREILTLLADKPESRR